MLDLSEMSATLARSSNAMPLFVASDIDGTITIDSKIHSSVLSAIEMLHSLKIGLILVTGRAAGFAYTLFETLGAEAVIAENGGILYLKSSPHEPYFSKDGRWTKSSSHESTYEQSPQKIGAALFEELQAQGILPRHAQKTYDNLFRLTDFTFELEGIDQAQLVLAKETLAQGLLIQPRPPSNGSGNPRVSAAFVYSSIHAHIMPLHQDKGTALKALARLFQVDTQRILTIGDSLNDETLFDQEAFPFSVGVANLSKYLPMLGELPRYMTENAEGHGFSEMVRALVGAKSALAQKQQGENVLIPFQDFHPIVFIDGVCVLCNTFADFVLAHNVKKKLKLASLQGNTARRLLEHRYLIAPPQSVVLYEEGTVTLRSAAILKILRHLGAPYRQIAAVLRLIPTPLRDAIYELIARYRYKLFGKRETCRLPTPEEKEMFLD